MPISEVTRRNLFDEMRLSGVDWSGRLSETDFLSRLYDLRQIRSNDHRFSNAAGDIAMHRENFRDWDDYWIFDDARFNLLRCEDETLLKFLAEMVHPIVQPNSESAARLVEMFNRHLRPDGFEIAQVSEISGHPIFGGRLVLTGSPSSGLAMAAAVADALNSSTISQQITRMETSIDRDPGLAVGTAKEFLESICKGILGARAVTLTGGEDLPRLVRLTCSELELLPDDVPEASRGTDTVRRLLSNLASIGNAAAELRNLYGTGHGPAPSERTVRPRHARLAVQSAVALGVFLWETFKEQFGQQEVL